MNYHIEVQERDTTHYLKASSESIATLTARLLAKHKPQYIIVKEMPSLKTVVEYKYGVKVEPKQVKKSLRWE